MVFAYADSLGRCGESVAGRRILERMIVGMSMTKYGPILLVRLADISARGGRDLDAAAVYRTVAENFPGTRAAYLATTRLADRRLFSVNSNTFSPLANEYRDISRNTSDPVLKEEALFKVALTTSLYGPSAEAVQSVTEYLKKFPAGVFANVAATMREDLLLSLYRELALTGDCKGVINIVRDNRGYLARCVGDKEFIPHISGCFKKMGMIREELEILSSMADTEWVGPNEAFLHLRIHEDAWALEEFALAEASGRLFLEKYSTDGKADQVRERVGWIQYRHGDMASVLNSLSPLLNKKKKALNPVSYYYLGKAYEKLLDLARARKAMSLYIGSLPQGTDSALTADARMVIASAQLSGHDLSGALQTYREGFEASREDRRDMFLYKMGEACLALNAQDDARSHWEQLVHDGKDPVWKSLAIQSLADLAWRKEWKQ
jgi:TolA-binding protein